MEAGGLTFLHDGAQRFAGAATPALGRIEAALAHLPSDQAGLRLSGKGQVGIEALRSLLAPDGTVGMVAASVLGPDCKPVRAILFDKTEAANWSLAWHQDRVIAVAERVEVEGFGPWTVKGGMHHVAPPFELLAAMATLRVHLDAVDEDNAPLLVAPGSHRMGRVPVERIEETVQACGTMSCTAEAGDVWLYATPILHASEAASRPRRRRVLQLDYAVGDLPRGLRWLGV